MLKSVEILLNLLFSYIILKHKYVSNLLKNVYIIQLNIGRLPPSVYDT